MLYDDFGARISIERTDARCVVRCSGESMWLEDFDEDDAFPSFVAEFLGSLASSQEIEMHLEDLVSSNSSTLGYMTDMIGKPLLLGCAVDVYYNSNSSFQKRFLTTLELRLDSACRSRFRLLDAGSCN